MKTRLRFEIRPGAEGVADQITCPICGYFMAFRDTYNVFIARTPLFLCFECAAKHLPGPKRDFFEHLCRSNGGFFTFSDRLALDDLKKEFRRLAKLHHPDVGGNQDQFVALQTEYAMIRDFLEVTR